MSRYPAEAQFSRSALAPGLLGAIVLLAGLALVGTSWETFVLYAAAILALIQCVFAWQGRQWWWLIGLIPIAVLWNPVWPITIPDLAWRLMQLAGAVVFIATAVSIKIPIHRADDRNGTQRRIGPQGGGRPKR